MQPIRAVVGGWAGYVLSCFSGPLVCSDSEPLSGPPMRITFHKQLTSWPRRELAVACHLFVCAPQPVASFHRPRDPPCEVGQSMRTERSEELNLLKDGSTASQRFAR